MTFERIRDSKRIISFILNTPMERPIFSLAYSYYCFRRQICTPSYAWNIEFMKERMCITALSRITLMVKIYYKTTRYSQKQIHCFGMKIDYSHALIKWVVYSAFSLVAVQPISNHPRWSSALPCIASSCDAHYLTFTNARYLTFTKGLFF